MKRQSLLIFLLLCMMACVPPSVEEEITEIDLTWKNKDLKKIHDFKDQHQFDSLLQYFPHKDPAIRYSLAQAFSSFKDPQALDSLYVLMGDNIPKVREMAAFSIGQIGDPSSESFLLNSISKDTLNRKVNANIFEAVGKFGTQETLNAMAAAKDYKYEEDLETIGLLRGIYQFALRGIVAEEATSKVLRILANSNYPEAARIMAANYLGRTQNIDLKTHVATMSQVFSKTKVPFIKTPLAIAIGRAQTEEAIDFLMNSFEVEQDYRVKLNILRGLNNSPVAKVNPVMMEALKSENIHIANFAAEYFISNGRSANANAYRNIARAEERWPLKARLYEAANTHLTSAYTIAKRNSNKEILDLFKAGKTNFEKAAYLKALGPDIGNLDFIIEEGLGNEDRLIQIAASNIMVKYLMDKKVSPRSRRGVKILEAFKNVLSNNDPALLSVISPLYAEKDLRLNTEENLEFLKSKLTTLKLPKNLEAFNTITQAIAKMEGQTVAPRNPEFNHPINWSLVSSVNDSTTADILTNKGVIMVKFFPNETPGAVGNFIDLAMNGFYENKSFHRVVPNFVIQGGCPDGDGYGNLDYTIRTELSSTYYDDEGYLGMARTGYDTENTQWFITHSPTPHLDGKYTIFGKVIKGMETVHAMEEGDIIRKINMVNF